MTTQQIQFGAYGKGVVDQSGGTFTAATGYPVIGRFTGGSGVYNISGGTFTDNQQNTIVAEAGTGVLNVSGSGVVNVANQLSISSLNITAGTGTVNLASGGTIIANAVSYQAAGGYGLLNFSGGTLQSRNANTTFMQGLAGAYIYPGGATINTAVNIAIAQPLLAPTGYGVGSVNLTASGAGYQGEPIVTLSGGTSGGSGATARAIVSGGQITGIQITNPGSGYGANDVLTATLAGGGDTTAGTLGTVYLVPNSNAGGLTVAGGGILALAGNNTYYGPTTIVPNGTLQIGGGGAGEGLASPTISNSGTLTFNHTDAMTYAGVISGSGNLTTQSTGITTLSGSNLFTATVNIYGGGIGLVADSGLGNAANGVNFGASGTLQFAAPFSLGGNRTINIGGSAYTATMDTEGNAVTVASLISGGGALAKISTGTLTLTNTANSYSGGTQFNAGVLAVDSDSELGAATGNLTFNGGTLRTLGTGITSARNVAMTGAGTIDINGLNSTLSGNFSGAGVLTVINGGSLVLSGTNSSITGAVNIRSDGVVIPSGASFTTSNVFSVGDVSGTSGLLTQTGGTLNAGTLYVGSTGTAIGIVNQSGGAVGGGTAEWRIGGSGSASDVNAKGTYDLSGGSIYSGVNTNFQVAPTARAGLI